MPVFVPMIPRRVRDATRRGDLVTMLTFTGTTFKGTTTVDVYVYDKDWPGGCLLPLLN